MCNYGHFREPGSLTKQEMASLTDVVLISGASGRLVMVICWGMRWCNFKGRIPGRIRVDCLKSGLAIGRVSERITHKRNPGGRDPTTAACHP